MYDFLLLFSLEWFYKPVFLLWSIGHEHWSWKSTAKSGLVDPCLRRHFWLVGHFKCHFPQKTVCFGNLLFFKKVFFSILQWIDGIQRFFLQGTFFATTSCWNSFCLFNFWKVRSGGRLVFSFFWPTFFAVNRLLFCSVCIGTWCGAVVWISWFVQRLLFVQEQLFKSGLAAVLAFFYTSCVCIPREQLLF